MFYLLDGEWFCFFLLVDIVSYDGHDLSEDRLVLRSAFYNVNHVQFILLFFCHAQGLKDHCQSTFKVSFFFFALFLHIVSVNLQLAELEVFETVVAGNVFQNALTAHVVNDLYLIYPE